MRSFIGISHGNEANFKSEALVMIYQPDQRDTLKTRSKDEGNGEDIDRDPQNMVIILMICINYKKN
jgi:hypothetical protein